MENSKVGLFYSISLLAFLLIFTFSSISFAQTYQINSMQKDNKVLKWSNGKTVDAGMSTGTVILIGVGVAAVVTAILIIANNGSDSTDVENSNEDNEEKGKIKNNSDDKNNGRILLSLFHSNLKKIQERYKVETMPIQVYLSMKQNNFKFSDNTFEIGIAFNF